MNSNTNYGNFWVIQSIQPFVWRTSKSSREIQLTSYKGRLNIMHAMGIRLLRTYNLQLDQHQYTQGHKGIENGAL